MRRPWRRRAPARPGSEGERLHVAFAIQALHDTSGGAERVLVDVANGLHRRGVRVSVLTYQERNGPPFYALDYGIERLDGRRRHSRRRRGERLSSLGSAASRRPVVAAPTWLVQNVPKVYAYVRLLRVVRPSVVVGFMPSAFPYVTLAALVTRTPAIASIHNVPDRELGGDPLRWDQNLVDIWVRRRSLRLASLVTVLLPSFVDQLPARVRPKTQVVPNMIKPFPGRPADVSEGRTNTIVAVGRLAPAKDHETLIRAWAHIESQHPSWQLRIVGRGPLEGELRSLATTLHLERLSFSPPTNDIDAVYTSARFLVMPSIHEGFGLVTAEAMACGLPVVGFADCEGTNEIVIDDENGLLVEPGEDRAAAFAAAMSRLIEDEPLRKRLGSAAPATIDRFDPDVVLDRWEAVIRSAVGDI